MKINIILYVLFLTKIGFAQTKPSKPVLEQPKLTEIPKPEIKQQNQTTKVNNNKIANYKKKIEKKLILKKSKKEIRYTGTLSYKIDNEEYKYEGEILKNRPDGYGKYIVVSDLKLKRIEYDSYKTPRIYIGNFRNGQCEGYGEFTDSDSSIYKGNWENGKMNGNGIIYYTNGNKYYGEWKNNKKVKGIYNMENGDKYEGDFKNGLIEGSGIFIWSYGAKYVGEYKANLKNGFGKLTLESTKFFFIANCPDCVKYIGYWKDDEKSGPGKCYDKDDNLLYDGDFKDNKPTDMNKYYTIIDTRE